MKIRIKDRNGTARTAGCPGVLRLALLGLACDLLFAQEIVLPPAIISDELLYPAPSPGLRLGIFDLYPQVGAMAWFDDNIFASSLVKESDLVCSISPAATISMGERNDSLERSWSLEYRPSFIAFAEHTEFTTVDQAAQLSGVWPFAKLRLGFSQDFDQASTSVLGVADRVEHRGWDTSLTSHYELSEKTSFEINGRQRLASYEDRAFTDSQEWVNDNWLKYQLLPKLNLGWSVTIGYLELGRNPDQLYERTSIRGSYWVTHKAAISASGGVERRDFSGTGSASVYPVFNVAASYHPTATMAVSLHGSRTEQNSAYLPDENYAFTRLSVVMQQVIWERFAVSLTGSYSHLDYHLTRGRLPDVRADDMLSVRPGLDWSIRRNVRAGLFYSHRHNTSSESFYDYSNNQVGVQTTWIF